MDATALSPSAAALLADGRIYAGVPCTRLAHNRPDQHYHGPVYQWCGALWILYGNRAVPVIHTKDNQYNELC